MYLSFTLADESGVYFAGMSKLQDFAKMVEREKRGQSADVQILHSGTDQARATDSILSWCYKNGRNDLIPAMQAASKKQRAGRAIICQETGDYYESISAAANALQCDAGNLSRHLANHPKFKSVKGLTFAYSTS